MIDFELLRDRGVLVVSPDGPLKVTDFEQLLRDLHEVVPRLGKLRSALLMSHLKFVGDHHRQIERIAAVTDSGFLKIMPRIADHFVQAKVKHFDFEQKDQALAWLETGR